MSKSFISLLLSASLCFALFLFVGCSDSISVITDIKAFSDMQAHANKIEVDFDNHTGKPFKFTVEDENDISEIMNIVLGEKLNDLGKDFPVGDNTFITIYQGEKSYRLSVRINGADGDYYSFSSADLQSKIAELAIAQGAYDIEVGVIYKVIDLPEIEGVKDEKITVSDKSALLDLIADDYGDCKYFYLYESESIAKPYTFGLTENELTVRSYQDTVTAGKGKLLIMWSVYQNYDAASYYLTSPSLNECVNTNDAVSMEFTFGLRHPYHLKVSVVS